MGIIFLSGLWWTSSRSSITPTKDRDTLGAGYSCEKPGLVPRIFESRTTHTRLFPTKHSFSYSYLLVGVPVGWNGSAGLVLSTDSRSQNEVGVGEQWFSTHADDYLQRGRHSDGLRGKLEEFLASQAIPPERYPSAYLVTAPRFCGFSFNPVSFWYLYDEHDRLGAMILEVNNTFDERRIYFLPRNAGEESNTTESKVKFKGHWEKDFHVSPFNDRDGSYSLICTNPFDPMSAGAGTGVDVDNTIVLNSGDGKPKIVARVFSTSPGIDPFQMSRLQTLAFVARWWWVGFMTNPRILREARALWTKKLQVFYRPEVLKSSIGRNQTAEERILEPFFRGFFEQVASTCGKRITYLPAAGEGRGKPVNLAVEHDTTTTANTITSSASNTPVSENEDIEIQVLTPAFYTEMAREPDLLKTFERFCFNPSQGQAMVYVSDVNSLREALGSMDGPPLAPSSVSESRIAHVNKRLRSGRSLLLITVEVLQSFIFSYSWPDISGEKQARCLDAFVQDKRSTSDVKVYDRTCLKVLLADRLALGYVGILDSYTAVAWAGVVAAAAWQINGFMHSTQNVKSSAWNLTALGAKLGMIYALSVLRG